MTSDTSSFPQRLTKIDALNRDDHWYLDADDSCFFLGEYSARKGFSYSATNNLIINLKKPMDRRGTAQWKYKGRKIVEASEALYKALGKSDLRKYTFVPIPPSKQRDHPMYDDRMTQVLDNFAALVKQHSGYELDIRELVTQTASTASVHDGDERPTPEELSELYQVNVDGLTGCKTCIVFCDDVLTTGCHYKAMKIVLERRLPAAKFRGVFLARRVPEAIDFDEVDDF